jgi:hypothetical protein
MVVVDGGRGRKRAVSWLLSTRLVTATAAVVSAVVAIHVVGGGCAVVMSRLKAHANQKFEVQLLQMEEHEG